MAFLLLGLFATKPFYLSQTADAQILQYGYVIFIGIAACPSVALHSLRLERLLQSTGKTFYIMITQGIGAVINIILDRIFIFGLFGVPDGGARCGCGNCDRADHGRAAGVSDQLEEK